MLWRLLTPLHHGHPQLARSLALKTCLGTCKGQLLAGIGDNSDERELYPFIEGCVCVHVLRLGMTRSVPTHKMRLL